MAPHRQHSTEFQLQLDSLNSNSENLVHTLAQQLPPVAEGCSRLYLCRHGQTDFNFQRKLQGRGVNMPLNDQGLEQARNLARAMKDVPLRAIYSSSLKRAFQTADAVAQLHPKLEVEAFQEVEEMNFGDLEGHPMEMHEDQIHTMFKRWGSGEFNVSWPKGESPMDVVKRGKSKIDEVLISTPPKEQVLMVTHGRFNKIVLAHLLHGELTHMTEIEQDNTCVNVVDFNHATQTVLNAVNGDQSYDVIVVGSGPGGLVAAEYLSREPTVSVLVLEAGPKSMAATGGTDTPDYAQGSGLTMFDIPAEYDNIMYNPKNEKYRVDWITDAYMWLGKSVGGCSSFNSATYFRPPDAYTNQSQWPFSAAQMNAKMDENELMHGHTDQPSPDGKWYSQEGYAIVSKALLSEGYSERTLNDASARNNKHKTFGHAPFTIKGGKRDSPATAFWGKMRSRSNVKLLTDAKVDYLVHDTAGKVTGVVYSGESQASLSSRGAVLMAAGALSTPKVLIQSGVGPNSQLNLLKERNKFPGVSQAGGWISNSNVGRNLFDSGLMYASFSHPNMTSFHFHGRPAEAINQYMHQNFTGPWAGAGPVLISYESYDVQGRTYEFQSNVLAHAVGEFDGANDTFTISLYVNNPESRAASGFDSNGDWQAYNDGDAYFDTPRDLAAMQSYAQRMVRLMENNGAKFLSAPGSDPNAVAAWVKDIGSYTSYFFGGTCYASSDVNDIERCANEKLRVLGLQNVFLADASAMRDGTVNPYGFVMYIGREAADQVKSFLASGGSALNDTCSGLENDVNYVGNDVGNQTSASADGCCSICSGTSGCQVFTWTDYNGGTCWLKSSKGTVGSKAGTISGVLRSTTNACFALEDNVAEPHGVSMAARSADKCCSICKATGGCKAYTWQEQNGGTCTVKGGKEKRQ
ncbi:hypothetical protein BBJ29_007048 [Phytophthora kernoviae]|uniref:Apple domain-containing protein n=1 Tax=Phytophthora kernoviae TaxID=325452 RepID=A0A3F2RF52_9STRA|nr:hypothetical protein BBJ29_007048 [Phytophthora kernoviae]RLN55297.1 hypothetical protein BBP00_00008572 [Phytophthora kernoviae]